MISKDKKTMLDLTLKIVKNRKKNLKFWADQIIQITEEEIEELKVLQKQIREFQKRDYNANSINISPRLSSNYVEKKVDRFIAEYMEYQTLKMIAEAGEHKENTEEKDYKIEYSVSTVLGRVNTGYQYGFNFLTTYDDYDKAWDEFVRQVDFAEKDKKRKYRIELYEEIISAMPDTLEGPITLYHYENGKVFRTTITNWEESVEEVKGNWREEGYHPAEN